MKLHLQQFCEALLYLNQMDVIHALPRPEPVHLYRGGGYNVFFEGQQLGGQQLVCKLGIGSFSSVWAVKSKQGYRALKISRADQVSIQQMRAEMLSYQKFKDLPGVLRFYQAFWYSSAFGLSLCLLLDLAGPSLRDLLEGRLLTDQDIQTFEETMDTLLGLWRQRGVAHCDLKPQNICQQKSDYLDFLRNQFNATRQYYLAAYGIPFSRPAASLLLFRPLRFVVVDLASARELGEEVKGEVQTLHYRCPQAIEGERVSGEFDNWSLGCIIAELLLGQVLFEVQSQDDLRQAHALFLQSRGLSWLNASQQALARIFRRFSS